MFVEKYISIRDVNNIQVITMKLCNQIVPLSFPFYKIVDILKDFFFPDASAQHREWELKVV